MMPKVTFSILNWNQKELTLDCLDSLADLDYPNYDVVVVDNGSREDEAAGIRARFPAVTVVENERNVGFSEGNNVAIRRAVADGADYVLLLNNDTTVDPQMLSHMVDAAQNDPQIGIVGPKICYYDEPETIWSAGGLMERRWDPVMRGLDAPDDGSYDALCEVDWVSGCALMIRSDVMAQIGLIDPRYFIYYEESDWCCRAREAGFKIFYVPQALMWHKIQPRQQAVSARHVYLMTRNRLLFVRCRGVGWPTILSLIVAENLRTVGAWTVWQRHREKRPMRRAMLRGVSDFLAGRFGEPPGDL